MAKYHTQWNDKYVISKTKLTKETHDCQWKQLVLTWIPPCKPSSTHAKSTVCWDNGLPRVAPFNMPLHVFTDDSKVTSSVATLYFLAGRITRRHHRALPFSNKMSNKSLLLIVYENPQIKKARTQLPATLKSARGTMVNSRPNSKQLM